MNDKGEVPAVLWILGALFIVAVLVSLSSPPTGETQGNDGRSTDGITAHL